MTRTQTSPGRAGPATGTASRTVPRGCAGGAVERRVGGRGRRPGEVRAIGSPEVLDVVMLRLRVICEPTRVQLMVLLDQGGRATVQQLTDRLPTTHQNVSKHLRVLHDAGMVARSRDGVYVYYELADWSALWLVEQIASSIASHLELQQQTLRPDPT